MFAGMGHLSCTQSKWCIRKVQSSAGQDASLSSRRNAAFSKNPNQPFLAASPLLRSSEVVRRRIAPMTGAKAAIFLSWAGQTEVAMPGERQESVRALPRARARAGPR